MKKIYQVIIVNELDVLINLGFYEDLDDAIEDINRELSVYNIEPLKKGDLVEYPSNYNMCFDRLIYDKDEMDCIHIGGFIFDKDELLNEIKEIHND